MRSARRLLGLAFRTRLPVAGLALPDAHWAEVRGGSPSRADLRQIDANALHVAGVLENLEDVGVTPDNFDALFGDLDVRFVVPLLSDGTRLATLEPGGERKRLSFETARAFAAGLVRARLRENDLAVAALKAGFEAVVPRRLLALYSPRELARDLRDPPPRPADMRPLGDDAL